MFNTDIESLINTQFFQNNKKNKKRALVDFLSLSQNEEKETFAKNETLAQHKQKKTLIAKFKSLPASMQRLLVAVKDEKLSSLEKRRQQMNEFGGRELTEEEKEMNRLFVIASANVGIAALSLLFYPPLILVTIPIEIYCCIPFYRLGYKALVEERRISSYTLEAFLITGMLIGGYFYTEVIMSWFYILGLKLMLHSENNAKTNLSNLFGTQPRTVWVMTEEGVEVEIPFEQMQHTDTLMVHAGQMISVDGVITDGFASIDQHKLTGESQPVEKGIGDSVLASTIVLAGKIGIKIEKTGEETVSMQIGQILDETTDFTNALRTRGETIADKVTLPTLGLSILFLPFFGYAGAITVLTNPFGSKIRLFSPASLLTFLNIASSRGILIKDGRSLELLKEIDTIVFDKTGTLTLEQPTVGMIHTYGGVSEDTVLHYAAAAEAGQSHPIAKAIISVANERGLAWPNIIDAKYEIGSGIQVDLGDCIIRVGSDKFMRMNNIEISNAVKDVQSYCHQNGYSLVMVASDMQIIGIIELHATIRPEAQSVISNLRKRGMSMHIISGDHDAPTKKLADTLGIDNYFANTLPENKADLVAQLQKEGKAVCFVGDGINDSIALKKANVSVSLRGATTIATDTAQVILMDSSLNNLEKMFDVADELDANMRTNLLLSTVPSAVCIAGIIFFHWGVVLGATIAVGTLFVGMVNSIMPMLKSEQTNDSY